MSARISKNAKAAQAGFTLVELLVVIGIIGLLMALFMPAISSAFKKAVISKARTEMSGISAAIKAYYAEYGVMPAPNINGDPINGQPDYTFMGKWVATNPLPNRLIFDILRGINTTNNPKRILFLDVPVNSLKGTSTMLTHKETYVSADGCYLDPWRNPYIVVMDTDFDGQIGGFAEIVGQGTDYPYIKNHLISLSPYTNGVFPGVIVGVMSYGPNPGSTNSFLTSW
jgi:prepilin-type N-terminal cleavage/methylation domain-containing protein